MEENQDQNKKLDSDEEENGVKFIFRLDNIVRPMEKRQ